MTSENFWYTKQFQAVPCGWPELGKVQEFPFVLPFHSTARIGK